MELFFAVLPSLIFIVLICAIGYGIFVVLRRQRDFSEGDPGIGTIRRVYFYTVSLASLMMVTNGIVQIGQYVLNAAFGDDLLTSSQTRLALGVSLVIIGLPLWLLHWRMIGKYVREIPVEANSIVRKIYIYLILMVSLGISIEAGVSLVQWGFNVRTFNGYSWAAMLVWVGVWLFHWVLELREGQHTQGTRTVRRLYLYIVSSVALVSAALGFAHLIHSVLREAYRVLATVEVLGDSGIWPASTMALSTVLITFPVWAIHWLYFAKWDHGSVLRKLHLYGLAVFGGVITILVAIGIMVYGFLVWTIGVSYDENIWIHFSFSPGVLTSVIVGGSVLVFHWIQANRERLTSTMDIETDHFRVAYIYLLVLMGLITLVVGIVTLVNISIGMLGSFGQTMVAGRDLWRNGFALGFTFVVIGGPIWVYCWAYVQRRIDYEKTENRNGLARKSFILGVLGVGMLFLMISTGHLTFMVLTRLLEGHFASFLLDAKLSISISITVMVFVTYYWLVYREDRITEHVQFAEKLPVRKLVTVLLGSDGADFLEELQNDLGYGVSSIEWTDVDAKTPKLSPEGFQSLLSLIRDASGDKVILVPLGTTFRVFSYH